MQINSRYASSHIIYANYLAWVRDLYSDTLLSSDMRIISRSAAYQHRIYELSVFSGLSQPDLQTITLISKLPLLFMRAIESETNHRRICQLFSPVASYPAGYADAKS